MNLDVFQLAAIVAGAIISGGVITKFISGIVRKSDNTSLLPEKYKKIDANQKEIENLKTRVVKVETNLEAAFVKLDLRSDEIKQARHDTQLQFGELQSANNLIFKAILGIARKVEAADVVDMLDKETVITTKLGGI